MKKLIPILLAIVLAFVFVPSFASAATCYCDEPGGGVGHNHFTCTNGITDRWCATWEVCYGSSVYPAWPCRSSTTTTTYYQTYTSTYYPTYTSYYPTYPYYYSYPTYNYQNYPQTCYNKGGNICGSYQYCSGYYTSASDTSSCCIGSCIQNVCTLQVSVQVSPTVVQNGNSVTISGYATTSNAIYQNIQVKLMIDNYNIATVYPSSNGYFTYTYVVSGLSTGGHTITATAWGSNCNQATAYATLTVNTNQACTPGQTRNQFCVNSYTSQYEQCSSDGTTWYTYTNYCSNNQCVNGYCGSSICTSGQTRNYQCYSGTSFSYEYCYGNYWQTIINSCPGGTYCSGGSCTSQTYYPTYYQTYPYYYNNYPYYNSGYGTLAVNVRDCSNNNYVPSTVQVWPGGYSQYSSTGVVMFYGMSQGTYTMSASSPGYNTQSGSATVYYSGQSSADLCLSGSQPTTQTSGEHCLKVTSLTGDGEIKAGSSETFKASINNCGTFTESSIRARLKMFGTSSDATISSLSPGQTQASSISIDVPSDAAGKEKAVLEVSNSYNSLIAEKTFDIQFGQPVLAVKALYEANRCEINSFTFDLMNVGKAKEIFTVWASGPAKDWVHFSPDTVTVDAGDRVTVNGVAAVPCSAQVGDYTFTINAKDKTTSAQTTSLRVVDGRSLIGMLIFPELSPSNVYILGLLVLILILFIIIAYILWKRNGKGKRWVWFKERELPGEPEAMAKKK